MSVPMQLAGRTKRLIATLIDALLVPSLTLVLVVITGVVEHAEDYADNWWILHVFLLAVLGYLILNGYGLWRSGQTVGKLAMGIAIVSATTDANGNYDGQPAPIWKLIAIRALFFPLLFAVVVPPITLITLIDQLMIFGKKRRCLHDLVSGTVVVQLDRSI